MQDLFTVDFGKPIAEVLNFGLNDLINTTNLCEFLQMSLPRTYLVNFYADTLLLMDDHAEDQFERMLMLTGSTPLTMQEIASSELNTTNDLCHTYPGAFDYIYGDKVSRIDQRKNIRVKDLLNQIPKPSKRFNRRRS